jgi:A/G-specific adenine glycosylase
LAKTSSPLRPAPPPDHEHALPDAAALLAWYDRHRRALPWRALPGETADPYRVWLSEIMLQQTTVRAVKPYFERFLALFPTVQALAGADVDEVMRAWAGLGYYSRARNLHACAKAVVEKHAGTFPPDEAGLRSLPGIGAYTSAAIAAIAFDRRAVVVDGNVERVVTRLFTVEEPLPRGKPLIKDLADRLTPDERPGDFAQAMMDLGATICTPRSPACGLCPWREPCNARREGTQETYPRKEKKTTGKLRRGSAFVALTTDGRILVRTRPPKGLLGGMTETPTTAWSHDHEPAEALAHAPLDAAWRRLPGVVEHVFTHFPLSLTVFAAQVRAGTPAPEGCRWVPVDLVGAEALPNVMRKVVAHALER